MGLAPELKTAIDEFVQENKVVLFMKGTKQFPQCGFSNTCVQARAYRCRLLLAAFWGCRSRSSGIVHELWHRPQARPASVKGRMPQRGARPLRAVQILKRKGGGDLTCSTRRYRAGSCTITQH